MKPFLILFSAALLVVSYVVVDWPSPGEAAEDTGGAQTRRYRDPSDSLYRITDEEVLSLEVSASESSPGVIRYIQSGRTISSWNTGTTTGFGIPVVMGSYPDQVIVVPVFVGGGTGVGKYGWVSIVRTEGKPLWKDMGLWATWSSAKDHYDFSLSPHLLGPNKPILFEFRYNQTKDDMTRVVGGRLALGLEGKDGPSFSPYSLGDALSLVDLLDTPMEDVRSWAGAIVQKCLPEGLGASLERKGWKKPDEADRKTIDAALTSFFEKKLKNRQ